MRKFIKKLLSRKQREINLLIIGPPSCGKTAIIYFLYQFASIYLRGIRSDTHSNEDVRASNSQSRTGNITEVEMKDFITEIKRETETSFDFVGTDVNSIRYVSHDTGDFILRIYNISGEIFSKAGDNQAILTDFANHVEGIDLKYTFTLLCYESVAAPGSAFAIDLPDVMAFFSVSHHIKAYNLFTRVARNINTLRVVTKFDQVQKPVKAAVTLSERQQNFMIMQELLYQLNRHPTIDFMDDHAGRYRIPEKKEFDSSFQGKLWRKFICTGIYDIKDYQQNIYETLNVPGADQPRSVLKPLYRSNGMAQLGMFGIAEIFSFILQRTKLAKKYRALQPPAGGIKEGFKLSNADYKAIVGIN